MQGMYRPLHDLVERQVATAVVYDKGSRREVLDVYLRCYTAICPPPDKSKAPEPAPETDVCERWVPLKWVRAGMKAGLAKDLAHGPLNELVTALGDSTEELTITTPPVRPPE